MGSCLDTDIDPTVFQNSLELSLVRKSMILSNYDVTVITQ